MRASDNLENKIPLGAYRRVQLECMKVQTHSSLELQLEYNQDQTPLTNQDWLLPISIT